MSYKKSKSIHVNRPEIDGNKSGRRRQNAILRLKRQDYTILQQDECMVHVDDNAGYRNRTPVGRPQVVRYMTTDRTDSLRSSCRRRALVVWNVRQV